jgi:hypothetical protein
MNPIYMGTTGSGRLATTSQRTSPSKQLALRQLRGIDQVLPDASVKSPYLGLKVCGLGLGLTNFSLCLQSFRLIQRPYA